MTEVPANELSTEDLQEWYRLSAELKKLRAAEITLRKKIFGIAFPDPREGTNNFEIGDGYVLKATHTLNRDVDQGAFSALRDKLRQEEVNPDELVEYKPKLIKREYNKLSDAQRQLFDQCLVIKPGSPSMDIVLPKQRQKD